MINIMGERLHALITANGHTNAQAAEKIGVSASLVSDVINGKKKNGVSVEIVKKFAHATL